MPNFSIKAVLSADPSKFVSGFGQADKAMEKLQGRASRFSKNLGSGILQGIGQQLTSLASSGISDVVSGLEESSAAWQTFEGNMKIFGKSSSQIKSVRNELQSFAQASIYSASDMASTYAQLAAVGTKNTTELVKGFGGLAAAATNPQQAMKTLSEQATQMAAKPKVAWQDFKLMLEQTPAGMAAVAKQLGKTGKIAGKSTADLIKAVQDGTLSTNDFFDAIEKVAGSGTKFGKMATKYKTVGEAMDGLKETAANTLLPAFQELSKGGISAIGGLSDAIGKIDANKLAEKIKSAVGAIKKYWDALKQAFEPAVKSLSKGFKAVGDALGDMKSGFGDSGSVKSFGDAMEKVSGVAKKFGDWIQKHSKGIANAISFAEKHLPQIAGALVGFKIVKSIGPGMMTFAKGIGKLAKIDGKSILGKLLGVSQGEEAVGAASAGSWQNTLAMAAAIAAIGGAVFLAGAGLKLMAEGATEVAGAGPAAVGVLFGMVAAIGLLAKVFEATGPALAGCAGGLLAFGGAVALAGAGMWIMAQASVAVANGGPAAIAVFFGMIGAVAGLALVFSALGPALDAAAPGMVAFGVALLLVGAGAALAGAGMYLVSGALPNIVNYGASAAVYMGALALALLKMAPGAVLAGAGMTLLGGGMAIAAASSVILMASLTAINGLLKSIKGNAKTTASTLTGMMTAINAVKSGFSALKGIAGNAINGMISNMSSAASRAQAAGTRLGTGYTSGVRSGISGAGSAAASLKNRALASLRGGGGQARRSGYQISAGFAAGIRSGLPAAASAAAQLAAIADKAVRAKAKIHSPSRVQRKNGQYIAEGLILGIRDNMRNVKSVMQSMGELTNRCMMPELAGAYDGMSRNLSTSLNDEYEYSAAARYTVIVPVDLDGKEVARVTAPYTEEQLKTRAERENRKKGIR